MSFKVGDIVQLKAGGPDMTVTRIGTAGGELMVWCVWFEGARNAYALFPPDALKAPSLSEPAEALRAPLEPQPKALREPGSTAAPKPEQGTLELPEVDKPPPQPQPTPERQPTEADTAWAFRRTKTFTWAFSKPKPLPTEADNASITNPAISVAAEATEAKRDSHPTQADSEPRAEKKEESLEDQIRSMQSLMSDWLKPR